MAGRGPGRKQINLSAQKKRARRARKKPLKKRPPLGEALRTANRVAKARSNRRISGRKNLRMVQASLDIPLPEIGTIDFDQPEEHPLSLPTRILRFFIGLLLAIPCAVTTITLFQRVSEKNSETSESFINQFWQTPAFLFFTIGCSLCTCLLVSGVARKLWLYLYVLGHELTHVIFIYLSFGRVSGFSVGLDGGYVVTNKSNVLIALSPYFIPFWSLIYLLVLIPLNYFIPGIPYFREGLFLIVGATWTFHLLFTCWMIPRDQPDLKENETFFSLMLIILANIILLSALLCFSSTELGWRDFVYNWYNNFLDLFIDPILLRFQR